MTTGAAVDEQLRVLRAGTVDCITEDDLRARLAAGRPLRVKLGIDPTASDIHLGFAVVLRKLRQFQEYGHVAVLILGDFTARVGDPSGKSATRPQLSKDEIEFHAATYVQQVEQILLREPLEVRRNSEWLDRMGIDDVLRLASRTTVARTLDRHDFAERYRSGVPIAVSELLYPLLQGWDSVVVEADVELGGTDQLFNNLAGRQLQEQEGQEPQVVLTTPLLEGLDGVQKMSKSLGNYIGVSEPPEEQFGKLMSIRDDLLPKYFALATGWPPGRVEEALAELEAAGGAERGRLKRLLARTVVDLYHGEETGATAEAAFDRVFRERRAPEEVPEVELPASEFDSEGRVPAARLLARADLVTSNKDGQRKIRQGAVRIDGNPLSDADVLLTRGEVDGRVFQVGKRRWVRIRVVG